MKKFNFTKKTNNSAKEHSVEFALFVSKMETVRKIGSFMGSDPWSYNPKGRGAGVLFSRPLALRITKGGGSPSRVLCFRNRIIFLYKYKACKTYFYNLQKVAI